MEVNFLKWLTPIMRCLSGTNRALKEALGPLIFNIEKSKGAMEFNRRTPSTGN